jgi:replicative DNA helicase
MAFEDADPSSEVFDEAERQIFELGNVRSRSSLKALNDEMQETASFLEGLMGRTGELSGLPTGFAGLDQKTGGFQEGDLIIIAARPSMGKTALALNIARNTAVDHGKKVAFFSLEMTSRSLVLRMLASEAQVDASVFRSGLMGGDVFKKLMAAAGRLAEEKIWIDDSSVSTVRDIRAKARRLHARENLDLIIVDYLQLARGDGRSDNREQEISAISRGLKSLAGELKVPVIAVSQLNRGPESRGAEDKRPLLSDLRESGAIEQDADVIAFIYRDVVYNRETEFEDMAELIIAKQRNGPTGTVKLQFNSRFAQFTDWDRDDAYAGASGSGLGPTLAPSSFDGDF